MLQRAASNAYSWWWASHIRTKQSKWLEHNLQGMEEKVKYTLKIINEDGDTFSQRADMYYRKRPEIVNFVEEAFRSYRALAERYDHLSTELQNANQMIATAFPEHVHFDDDDDDDDDEENNATKPKNLPLINIPEIPKKEFKSQSLMVKFKEPADMKRSSTLVSSGFSKEEAMKEIDKIHKEILVLQTEKEFVRSSYENSYEMYWNLENEVTEMQKRVCSLQDEFGFGEEIEDCEGRRLVAITALRSCKDMIAKLEETQKRVDEEAEIEKKRIEILRNKFEIKVEEEEDHKTLQDSREIQNLSNVELTEKIDELVEKVVSLETTSSSYTALVKTLRLETDELHEHICGVEEDKACLVSNLKLEDELRNVRNLLQRVQDQKKYLQKHLTEAKGRSESLLSKIQDMKMDEDDQEEDDSDSITKETEIKSVEKDHSDDSDSITKETEIKSVEEDHSDDSDSITKETKIKSAEETKEAIVIKHIEDQDSVQEEKPETQESCLSTEAKDQLLPADYKEDKENVLLDEYTSVLRDYREMKRKLNEVEKKNRDGFFELALQLRELKNAVSSEYVSISHSSNSSISMPQYQQEGDLKRIKEDEVKVKSADTTAEKKVREDIDAILEENIEFWLRFSTSLHQIQKYQTAVQDLKSELSKLRTASDSKPIHRHLRDIQTELQLWLENIDILREELEGRYTTLCKIKDEVSRLTSGTEINSYQAAKFHGEILNMKQENKRVFNELQAGLDRARDLRIDVERVVCKLEEDTTNAKTTRSLGKSMFSNPGKAKIPLRSFLFGVKLKKYKQQKKQTTSILQKQCSYIVSTE